MVKPRREQLTNAPINTEFSKGLVFDEQNAGFGAGHVAAGKGIIWIDNTTSPNRLMFTDESGIDHDISGGGGGTLANTLIAGNTTGATNIQITNGQAIVGDPGVLSDGGGLFFKAGDGSVGFGGGDVSIQGGAAAGGA